MGGNGLMATPDIQNGITPTHADPSRSSISNRSGISGLRKEVETGQWRNSRSCHVWHHLHGREGTGQGR
jgi:hypothetical protein